MRSDGPSAIDQAYSGPANLEHLGRAAQGAHLLSEELWEALRDELDAYAKRDALANVNSGAVGRTAALAERLSDVAAALVLLTDTERRASVPSGVRLPDAPRAQKPAANPAQQAHVNAVLIDERDESAHDAGPARSTGAAIESREPEVKPRTRPRDSFATERIPPFPAARQQEELNENGRDQSPTPSVARQREMPDEHGLDESDGEQSAAWIKLIEGALHRFRQDRLPFAVLLIEVLEVEQLHRGLRLAELPHLMRQIESASTRALEAVGARSAASLALEGATRLWLQVPEMDRLEAHELVERLVGVPDPGGPRQSGDPAQRYFATLTAHRAPSSTHDGRRLELAIGTAVCPEDGQDVAALVTHASRELAAMCGVRPPSSELNEPA